MHDAAKTGNLAELNLMIKSAPERINEADGYGYSPLHRAAQCGQEAAISRLLSAKADVHKTENNGWTPLHLAAHNDQAAAVSLLLSAKADVNKTNHSGRTPLYYVKAGHHRADRVKQLLREAGAH